MEYVGERLKIHDDRWVEWDAERKAQESTITRMQAQIESLEAHVKKLIRQAKTVRGSLFLPFNFFNQEQFASTAQFKRWIAYYEHASPGDAEARYQLNLVFLLERIAARKRLDLGSIRAHSSSGQAPQTTTRTACPDTSGSSCCYSRRRTEARGTIGIRTGRTRCCEEARGTSPLPSAAPPIATCNTASSTTRTTTSALRSTGCVLCGTVRKLFQSVPSTRARARDAGSGDRDDGCRR